MPTDTAGNWHPNQGWESWTRTFTDLVEANVLAACRFAETCRTNGFDPTAKAVKWWFDVVGMKEKHLRERVNMRTWPRYLTAKDWDSLAQYVENDAATKRAALAKGV